ncbi:MAG: phosphoglycerate kinase [Actinomycetes bacterium]|jgi:phosphoglycerate kinase|nr:phosphoglycerate kinase [Actinomycetes bacterium]
MSSFTKKTVKDSDVAGKRVLVRVDFNVPLDGGAVTDDTRIRAALPTIRYLIDHHARVILCSHLGRPKSSADTQYSLRPACRALARLLGRNVTFVDGDVATDCHEAAQRMVDGELIMIENLRFHPGEKANDLEFARQLADLAELYVNDAFGTAHRAHASTAGVAQHLPAVSGLLLAREIEMLTDMLTNPVRPFIAILGGSKVSEKLGVISRLIQICDAVLIGGGMAFTFLAAKGIEVGGSLVEPNLVADCEAMLAAAADNGCDILLPIDFVVAAEMSNDADATIVGREEIPPDQKGLDIGPATEEYFAGTIAQAKTVFWNGPMGVFELTPFQSGTKAIAEAVARNNRAVTVVGGGDSVAALKKFNLESGITFVSTGGGASICLLEGAALPGLDALDVLPGRDK